MFGVSSTLFLGAHGVLAISILLSMKTSISLHMKSIQLEKGFFPLTSLIVVILWGLFTTLRRTLGIVAFFIPSLGLFEILHHFGYEKIQFKIRMDYAHNISSEDKIAMFGLTETVYWNELDRWNYTNPKNPIPPDYSLYTGLKLQSTFASFFVLMGLQFVLMIVVKMLTSQEFENRSDVFKKFVHVLQNLNMNFPYQDWDDGIHTLEEYNQRHWNTTREMAASFAVTFIFSIISLCPLFYTGFISYKLHLNYIKYIS